MNQYIVRAKTLIIAHKFWSAAVALIMLWGGHALYVKMTDTSATTKYVVATAKKATIITAISGSGQVSSQSQIDLKPKASGEIIALPVAEGGAVKAGDVIARLDATDAARSVRDAEVSLLSAQLSLKKLEQPADDLSITQSENSLARASTTRANAIDALEKAYNDSFNDIADTFIDLPSVVSGLHDLLYTPSSQLGGNNVNNIDYYSSSASVFDPRGASFGIDADKKYQIAKAKYDKNFADYKSLDRFADKATLEAMIAETYDTALSISDAVKSANNLIQFYEDQMTVHTQKIPTLANTQLSTLNTYTGTVNSHLTSLLSIGSTIKNGKSDIADADRSIKESAQSYQKLVSGTDALDLESARLSVQTRENALKDAYETLGNYTVRAPFDGTLAKLSVKRYDSAGSGTAIGTLIGSSRMAEISLNEVDAAKVEVGDKVTLSFDAIDGLTIAGKVASVDTIGTVSSGVVTYSVKIAFDTQDDRVKSGMSVNASIITDVRADVLAVPDAAVKTQGDAHYVEVFDPPIADNGTQGTPSSVLPKRVSVTIGITNDTLTEIVSGLNEGDQIVTRTISGSTAATTQSAPSLIGGGGRTGGVRF